MMLPYEFANRHGVLLEGDVIVHRPGLGFATLIELRRVLGQSFQLKELPAELFQKSLTTTYQSHDGAAQQAAEEVGADMNLDALIDDLPGNTDLLSGTDDAPVIRLINAILAQAVREKASDVHLEPFEDRVAVRFRIDGILNEVLSPRPELAPVLVSRIKVMSRLDIAEKRLPQDGRITVRLAGHAVDLRVSVIPSAFGERVVLRLLDQAAGHMDLVQLDMPAQVQQSFERALRKPHGIILVTGPTGSGKTTTLYAGLSHINDRRHNIMTIEDPVEYLLPGIAQTQVNSKVDMTFARGLRAILRQDPDVVMVGEIRDLETAAIAVQASLTGHLVLSTLHTNTAIGAILRLRDMGIEPFLLASSLEVVMAQRLVRVLCPHCKQARALTDNEHDRFQLPAMTFVFNAIGCDQCKLTGYRGRTGIYELIELDEHLRQLIHESAAEALLLAHARQTTLSMEQNGVQRVLDGVTSIEEVLRVTSAS